MEKQEEGEHMRLDGFGIFVKDMGTMIRFYRDVLGFGMKRVRMYSWKRMVHCSCFMGVTG